MNFIKEKDYSEINDSPQKLKKLLKDNKVLVLRKYNSKIEPLTYFNKMVEKIGSFYNIDEDLKTGKKQEKMDRYNI